MKYLGLFAHVLAIRPWEIELLSVEEFDQLTAWLDDYNRSAEGEG